MAFCRFDEVAQLDDLTEVNVPTRFVFLVLGPKDSTNIWALTELGRAMAALLNDKVLCRLVFFCLIANDSG